MITRDIVIAVAVVLVLVLLWWWRATSFDRTWRPPTPPSLPSTRPVRPLREGEAPGDLHPEAPRIQIDENFVFSEHSVTEEDYVSPPDVRHDERWALERSMRKITSASHRRHRRWLVVAAAAVIVIAAATLALH